MPTTDETLLPPGPLTLVGVVWEDTHFDPDCEPLRPILTCTVGVVLVDTPQYIRIASEFFEDRTFRIVNAIPKGAIRQVIRIATVPLFK